MVYKEDFIAVIKNKGKILRERNGIVKLPFGSEYEVLMKNKNSVRALVTVEVDGKDALDGNGLIVSPNDEFSLKGFMKGIYVTNRFRFINKTKQIAKYRGDRIDDGVIRVEFKFEKSQPDYVVLWDQKKVNTDDPVPTFMGGGGDLTTTYFSCNNIGSSSFASNTTKCSSPRAEEGITVKGSKVDQSFMYGSMGELEPVSHVVNMVLQGYKGGKSVKKAITTKTKLVCSTCGNKSKSSAKFCHRCGTYLD